MSLNFQSSTSLQTLRPSTVKSVTFATFQNLSNVESLPSEQRWWISKFHLGSNRLVKSLSNYKSSTSSTHASFLTPSSDSSIISHITFAPLTVSVGSPYQLAIVSGPRICLYGGGHSQSSSLSFALARNQRRQQQLQLQEKDIHAYDDEEEDEEEDNEDPNALFGEKQPTNQTLKNNNGSAALKTKTIKPDRIIRTGGFIAHCASYREDGRLLVIGCDDGVVKVCDVASRAILRTFSTNVVDPKLTGTSSKYPIRTVGWLPNVDSSLSSTLTTTKDSDATSSFAKRICWSAGDDATLRLWDVSGAITSEGDTNSPILIMRGHGDTIRSCDAFISSEYHGRAAKNDHLEAKDTRILLITGSYDHTIRVWDLFGFDSPEHSSTNTRFDDRCVTIMNHGAPVECIQLIYPTNNGRRKKSDTKHIPVLCSAGGTYLKFWHPLTGTCLATVQTKHNKTITSICLAMIVRDSDDDIGIEVSKENNRSKVKKNYFRRLLTAGLDGLIRIHSAEGLFTDETGEINQNIDIPFLHGVKSASPITALAMSPDNSRLVIGTSTGIVTVRQKAKYVPQGIKRKITTSTPRAGTYSFFMRGANISANDDDHVVILQKRKKLQKYDELMRKFRYGDALDEALRSRDHNAIIAVLEELGRRRGLTLALSNRDEETLEPVLAFTANFISSPRFTPLLIGVANRLCDIYSDVYGQSDAIDELFEKLRNNVRSECITQQTLLRLVGQIDAVMYAAQEESDHGE